MSNLLQLPSLTSLTMSSTEIAKLTGKNHSDVLRDIRVQIFTGLYGHKFDDANFLYPLIQGLNVIADGHTKRTKEVLLDREHTLTLITGYDVKCRHAINKRWLELEGRQKLPISFAEALRMLADETEARQAAQVQIEADRHKVKFAEVVTESSNTRCVRVWVKTMKDENNLTVGEREVFKWLVDSGYIYRHDKGYLPKARYEANGANYFTVVIDEINGKPRRQFKITGKGVVVLTGKVVNHFKREAA